MKNNKGQVLVVFVMLLPLFFMMLALIIDVGILYVEKRKIDNTLKYVIKDTIKYDRTEEEMENLIKVNCDNINKLEVEASEYGAKIIFKSSKKSIFSLVIGKAQYEIKSNFVGSIKNEKIVIERVS